MKMLRLVCVLALVFGFVSIGCTEESKRTAKVISLSGSVDIKAIDKDWVAATPNMPLNQGDIIRTKANSTALLNVDGSGETATVEIKENSQLKLAELLADKDAQTQNTFLDLALGEILIKAAKLHSEKSSFQVKTPTSIVGVRGTTFSVSVEAIEQ